MNILKIFLNRNIILLGSLVLGLTLPGGAVVFKSYTAWILAVIMLFSVTGIAFKSLLDYKYMLKVTGISLLLNYLVLGIVMTFAAYFLIDDPDVFTGFIVIAATPPGVAVVPFSYTYKSDVKFALTGILGTYLAAIFLTPLILSVFSEQSVEPQRLLITVLQVIVLPLALSRVFRLKALQKFTEKARGHFVNWGFALLIYTAIGLNRELIFSDTELLIKLCVVLGGSMFGLGILFNLIFKKRISSDKIISRNLMLTIKSTGFSVATALTLFDVKTAVPSAVLSIFVLLYLLSVKYFTKTK